MKRTKWIKLIKLIKLIKQFMVFLFFVFKIVPLSAVELPAGTYEIIGKYNNAENTFTVYEGSEAEFKLYLLGSATIISFLPEEFPPYYQYYKIRAIISKDLINHDGLAEILEVVGPAIYHPRQRQFWRWGNGGSYD